MAAAHSVRPREIERLREELEAKRGEAEGAKKALLDRLTDEKVKAGELDPDEVTSSPLGFPLRCRRGSAGRSPRWGRCKTRSRLRLRVEVLGHLVVTRCLSIGLFRGRG